MAKNRRRDDQFSLLNEKTFNVFPDLHRVCRIAYRESGLSRDQVTDRMNHLAERYGVSLGGGNAAQLSKDVLDKWLSGDPARVMPLKALPIFCAVVGSVEPLAALAAPLDAEVIGPEDRRLLAWARAVREEKSARERKLALEKHL